MALPRKKSRTIVVGGETWYWRIQKGIELDAESRLRFETSKRLALEKNPGLKKRNISIMFSAGDLKYAKVVHLVATRAGDKPFMIKAEFMDCERLLPKVVAAVVAYAQSHAQASDKVMEIHNATQVFEDAIAASDEKESELGRIRYTQYKDKESSAHEQEADRNIREGNIDAAIGYLKSAIFYDKTNIHKIRKLDRIISEDQASPRLYNQRAFAYYGLHQTDPAAGHLEKACRDAIKATELDPDYALAYGTLAEILYAMSDTDGFYKQLETALAKGMKEKIDGDIRFRLKDEARFLALLDRFDKRDWIRYY